MNIPILGFKEGGGGQNYLRDHIHLRFRHAHYETKDWLPSLGSQGRISIIMFEPFISGVLDVLWVNKETK